MSSGLLEGIMRLVAQEGISLLRFWSDDCFFFFFLEDLETPPDPQPYLVGPLPYYFLHPVIPLDPPLSCQLYLYVYGLELPIRVKETVYENERWNPLNGFTNQVNMVFQGGGV